MRCVRVREASCGDDGGDGKGDGNGESITGIFSRSLGGEVRARSWRRCVRCELRTYVSSSRCDASRLCAELSTSAVLATVVDMEPRSMRISP